MTINPQSSIRSGHLFSQHSLNTFARCRRRFLLKYVERLPWPVPESESLGEYEEHLRRGRVFHQWVARQMLGIPMDAIVAASDDPELVAWWDAFAQFDQAHMPDTMRAVEMPLVVPLGRFRLYARYDLLAIDPNGTWLIVDWKTLGSRPTARTLGTRMQTRVYMYALSLAGHTLVDGQQPKPGQIKMLYWFANFPEEPAIITYSAEQMRETAHLLTDLTESIAELPREAFERTEDERQCRHCNYRTFCDRSGAEGVPVPLATWLDEDLDASLDLDQLEELDY